MTTDYDAIIVGCGFAGLQALSAYHAEQKRVCVVAKNFGATRYFSGAFDFVNPRFFDASLNYSEFSLSESFAAFCKAYPKHFYAQRLADHSDFFAKLVEESKRFFEFYDLDVVGDGETGQWAVGSLGVLKPTAFVMSSMALPCNLNPTSARVLVVGFPGLSDYPLSLIEKNLKTSFQSVKTLEYPALSLMPSSPFVSLLKMLEDEKNYLALCDFLKTQSQNFDLILIPPVLQDAFTQTNELLSLPVREMLSVLPSRAGMRVTEKLKTIFRNKKLDYHHGEVVGFEKQGDTLLSCDVESSTKSETVRLKAREFVLATGKYIGGGIAHKNQEFSETLLNLPLKSSVKIVKDKTPMTRMISDEAFDPQEVFSVGVDLAQNPWKNLKIQGHVLSGFDFTREHCGFGVSIASSLKTA